MLFILLLIVFAVHIGRHVNGFYVPESDFFDFRDKAMSLRKLDWPDHFKRPPLYAVSIALVSSAIPGQHRELYAAEIIGFIAALAGLYFFTKIATHFFGGGAIFVAWLWAFHPSTIRMAVKPKSELLVTVFILWAFYLFLKQKKSAYAGGFIASMVRYEGALAIAGIGIADFFKRKKKLQTMMLSLISGLPIVLWTVFNSSGGDGESYFSYFNEYKPNFAFLKTFWQGLVGFLPYQLTKVWILGAAGLLGLGLFNGWRRFRRETVGLLVFLIGFLMMHIIWPMPNFDYQIVIVWNALLFLGLGMSWLVFRAPKIFSAQISKPVLLSLGIVLFLLTILLLVLKPVPFPQYKVQWSMLLLFFIPIVAGLIGSFSWKHPVPFFAATFFICLLYFMASDTNALLYDIRYSKAEFRAVGEWFGAQHEKSEKMAVEQPVIIDYYAKKGQHSFLRLTELKKTQPDELHEWLKEQNVTYIAWMSANKIFETDNTWYEWKMENRGWKNIAFLADGKSLYGFTLIKEIKIGPRRAYIYKI